MAIAKQRIGIFGGSFDPPHIGHLIIAEHARVQLRLERVYFIPAHVPPHKSKKSTAASKHRLAMVKHAVRGNTAMKVSDYEIRRGGVSYTIDTVKEYRRRFPTAELFLIIGADNYAEFKTWKSFKDILRQVKLVVYPRSGGSRFAKRRASRAHFLRGVFLDISSSSIREAVRKKRAIRYIVPELVRRYIVNKKLYRK